MSTEAPSPAPGETGGARDDAAFLATEVAAALVALDAVVDVLAGVDLVELDGAAAAVITGRVAAASSRLAAVTAQMLPIVAAPAPHDGAGTGALARPPGGTTPNRGGWGERARAPFRPPGPTPIMCIMS